MFSVMNDALLSKLSCHLQKYTILYIVQCTHTTHVSFAGTTNDSENAVPSARAKKQTPKL